MSSVSMGKARRIGRLFCASLCHALVRPSMCVSISKHCQNVSRDVRGTRRFAGCAVFSL